ncbi:hypothetical protein [Cellulomonas hominis]
MARNLVVLLGLSLSMTGLTGAQSAQAFVCSPALGSLCSPTGLVLIAEGEVVGLGTATTGANAMTATAIAGTAAAATGVSGITFGSAGVTTVGAAAVGVGGWYAGRLVVGPGGAPVEGLDRGTGTVAGWAPGNVWTAQVGTTSQLRYEGGPVSISPATAYGTPTVPGGIAEMSWVLTGSASSVSGGLAAGYSVWRDKDGGIMMTYEKRLTVMGTATKSHPGGTSEVVWDDKTLASGRQWLGFFFKGGTGEVLLGAGTEMYPNAQVAAERGLGVVAHEVGDVGGVREG